MGVPAGPGLGRWASVCPLEGVVVASGGGVPGRAGLDSPVVGITPPVSLRGDVQAERLGGGFSRHPEVVRSVVRPADVSGK